MATLNQCQFIGNLGADPEIKYAADGTAICNFSIAVNESWFDKSSGEKRESTEWVRVAAYRKLAEISGEYLRKGSSIWIQGKMKTRKWQDQSGQDRYTTEIIANQMQMLGGRSDNQSGGSGGSEQQRQQQRPPAGNLMDMDDSIPF